MSVCVCAKNHVSLECNQQLSFIFLNLRKINYYCTSPCDLTVKRSNVIPRLSMISCTISTSKGFPLLPKQTLVSFHKKLLYPFQYFSHAQAYSTAFNTSKRQLQQVYLDNLIAISSCIPKKAAQKHKDGLLNFYCFQ